MHVEIVVPQIGEAVAELQIVAWNKRVGDSVQKGEVLFEVDSDKAIVEVESYVDGTLAQILADAGSAVMPRDVVGLIETEESPGESGLQESPSETPDVRSRTMHGTRVSPLAKRLATDLDVDLATITGSGPSGRVMAGDIRRSTERAPEGSGDAHPLASPKAKRMAAQLEVQLGSINGTGVDGLITSADVQSSVLSSVLPHRVPAQLHSDFVVPLTRLRQAVAQSMRASNEQVPHFYLMVDVNMSQVNQLRAFCKSNQDWERVPTYTDILVRACAQVLVRMPAVNVSYSDAGLIQHKEVGVGVAVSTDEGLVVPVVPGADRLSLQETSRAIRDVVDRARQGRMKSADLSPKSLVVSNLGMYGIDTFVAIIDMPDPMILAVGRVADKVVPVQGEIAIRPMCTLTLSVDHRALDGAQAAKFLGALKSKLENPFDILW